MVAFKLISVLAVIIWLAACGANVDSAKGFSLPKGDIYKGAVVFDDLQCADCHTIYRHNNKVLQRPINIRLGGPDKTFTYEYLVTSIINPSHKLADGYEIDKVSDNGESKMRRYNDIITVTELVDLVEYLKGALQVHQPIKTTYPDFRLPKMSNPNG